MLLTLVYVVFVINVPNHVDMVYIWCIYYVLFNFLYIIFDSFWIILCEIIYTYSKYLHPCLTNLGGALIYCSFFVWLYGRRNYLRSWLFADIIIKSVIFIFK